MFVERLHGTPLCFNWVTYNDVKALDVISFHGQGLGRQNLFWGCILTCTILEQELRELWGWHWSPFLFIFIQIGHKHSENRKTHSSV